MRKFHGMFPIFLETLMLDYNFTDTCRKLSQQYHVIPFYNKETELFFMRNSIDQIEWHYLGKLQLSFQHLRPYFS